MKMIRRKTKRNEVLMIKYIDSLRGAKKYAHRLLKEKFCCGSSYCKYSMVCKDRTRTDKAYTFVRIATNEKHIGHLTMLETATLIQELEELNN